MPTATLATSRDITKILSIPAKIKKYWETDSPLDIEASPFYVIIRKKMTDAEKQTLDAKLKQIGKTVVPSDIVSAVQWARR